MSRSDPVYRAIVNRWAIEHAEFATAIRPIMAWTLAMRSVAKKPNLNNVDLRRVFQRRDRWRRARKGFAEFVRAACREGEQVPVQSVKHWLKRLSPGREKQWIRGKYDFCFSNTFCFSLFQPRVRSRRGGPFRLLFESTGCLRY